MVAEYVWWGDAWVEISSGTPDPDPEPEPFSPADLEGLGQWLDASQVTTGVDGNTLDPWPDMSGNGVDAHTSANAIGGVYRPANANGLPCLEFNPANNRAYAWAVTPDVDNCTVFVVAKSDNITDAEQFLIGCRSTSSSTDRFYLRQALDDATFYVNGSQVGANIADAVDLNWHIWSLRANGTAKSGKFDDTAVAATIAGSTNPSVRYIGRSPTTVSGYWSGEIAEIIYYNRALTDPEVAQVEAYLQDKYSLAA